MRISDLARALSPALVLSGLLLVALVATHTVLGALGSVAPLFYLLGMTSVGGIVYGTAFLFLPIRALESEQTRWKSLARKALGRLSARRR
jgi:hypothetical protein